MSIRLEPPVPLVILVKTEPRTVIKNEPLEEALEEISPDIKDKDIVYHSLSEDLIKSETDLENILENKHLECVQTQALVKAENYSFIKTENITQRNKSEDTGDGNISRGTGQEVVAVQASDEHSNALSKLETDEQSVLNFSNDLNGISTRSRKAKQPEKTDFGKCYKTDETTLWEKEKEKIKVIKAPRIHIKSHEYTSLAENKHVCNHCQHSSNTLKHLKIHIRRKHRKDITMYQCPYCSHRSYYSLYNHIIAKHKSAKDIQWFQCHLCEKKFKLKCVLIQHMKVHLPHKQMQDRLTLREKRYCCDKCNYKTDKCSSWKMHKLNHLKPKEIQYFYCYHCSYKSIRKMNLKGHIFKHFKKEEIRFHCYICDFVTLKSELINDHIKNHSKVQIKSEINEKCHFKKGEIRYRCYICDFVTLKKDLIGDHIKNHSEVQMKSEINEES